MTKTIRRIVMEGGGLFGMFGGDPEDLQKHLQEMAEQMQGAQKLSLIHI